MADKLKEYECCVLLVPNLEPDQLDAEVGAIQGLIEERGGNISRIDRWNKRFLAFEIQGYREGFYVIFRWLSLKHLLPDLSYYLTHNDACLRYLVLDYTEKERKRRKRLGKTKTTEV